LFDKTNIISVLGKSLPIDIQGVVGSSLIVPTKKSRGLKRNLANFSFSVARNVSIILQECNQDYWSAIYLLREISQWKSLHLSAEEFKLRCCQLFLKISLNCLTRVPENALRTGGMLDGLVCVA
jgi:hypothetical protein